MSHCWVIYILYIYIINIYIYIFAYLLFQFSFLNSIVIDFYHWLHYFNVDLEFDQIEIKHM